ncbi:MAG: CynX/NimT family MFS transporter [Dehalococcoidia bacterium]
MIQTRAERLPYRYVILGILGIANLLSFLLITSLGILLPSISDDLGLSPTQQGWLGSSAVIGNLIFSVPMSVFLSRFNAKILSTVTLTAGACFVFMQGWAPIFIVLLLGRVLFGLSVLAREPARALLFAQWIPSREMVVANAVYSATYGFAIAVGFILTPFFLVWFNDSWRLTLTIYAIVTIMIAAVWQFAGRERATPEYRQWAGSQTRAPLKSVLKYRNVWLAGIGLFGIGINWTAMITFWPTLMLEEYDIPLTISGSIQAMSGVVGAVGGIVVALYIIKRDVRRPIVSIAGGLTVLSSIGMVSTGSVPLLVLLLVINGLGALFYPIIMTLPFELPGVKPREIAVAMAVIMTLTWAGGVVGPVLAGALQDATDDLVKSLIITSLFGLTMVAAGLFLSSQRREQVATT